MLYKLLIIPIFILYQQRHVTFTGVEYISGTDSIKVTVRIDNELFLRDYQQTIFDDLDLELLRTFKPFPSDLANNYLNSKISIRTNSRQLIGKLLKMEIDEGDILFYMLFRADERLKIITVKNTMLSGLCSDSENLIIVKSKNYESETKLSHSHPVETFNLRK